MSDSLRPHELQHSTPGLPVHHQLPESTQTHVHWVGDAIQNFSSSVIPFSSCPQSFPASGSFESALHIRWPKYWSFSISPSNEYSGLISFRIDWFDLLAVQGISRVFSRTIIRKHKFFGAQHSLWSNSHICTWLLGKTIALTLQAFVGKVMSLLFSMLSRFVIAFLSWSKCLLISWLRSPSAVILQINYQQ